MTIVYLRSIDLSLSGTPAELTAYRSAEVRRLLSDALAEHCGVSADAWVLTKDADGKPYLTSKNTTDGVQSEKPPCISLSHSGRWVACALSDAPVGVDVQEVRPIKSAVIKRFMPDADVTEADDRVRTVLWTRYEACLKRYGSRVAMVADAEGQCYDSKALDDAIVTVCHGEDRVEWMNKDRSV